MGFADNPIITSPFDAPAAHYELDEEGQPTGARLSGRRRSMQIVPVPAARRRGPQQAELELFENQLKENDLVNEIRGLVDQWRVLPSTQWGVSPETQRLLLHWRDPYRSRKLFFCQREAVETLIYLTEVAPKRFRKQVDDANAEANPGLFRLACKMATGAGKTTVMAMIIAWHAINRARRPSANFSDAFLVIAPGITIRDRLRVLLPQDPSNIYEQLDIVPTDLMDGVRKARIVITNYHAFMLRETEQVSKLSRQILGGREGEKRFAETDGEMIARVCREGGADLMGRKNIIVLNDEAHHCYRHKIGSEPETKLKGEEREEAAKNEEAARVWISGIEAFSGKLGLQAIYDLSATPFFLRGSGYPEGSLFPWVVSDFGLLDAIESGIVKVPRIPVLDDAVQGELPKFREVYRYVADKLPKKGRSKQSKSLMDPNNLPPLLLAAIEALYGHYQKTYEAWANEPELGRPPVFIVVANNTATSKLIYDWIAGYDITDENGSALRTVKGKLPLFSNVDDEGRWHGRRPTLLIDSQQLESGEALSDDFRKIAAAEIDAFKHELMQRGFGADADKLTDADILREAMNTVGKLDKLGGTVRCVVSVSMLTEGWDANTVTHIMGVRAFGTQLLCEQVVGRGLRRVSYEVDPQSGFFPVEYADVLGVPFTFAQSGADPVIKPPPRVTRVQAMKDRGHLEIRFPNVEGYRVVFPRTPLKARFSEDSRMVLTPDDIPVRTEVEPFIGEGIVLDLHKDHDRLRLKSVIFDVAGTLLREKFRDAEGNLEIWRYPELVNITDAWFKNWLTCRGNTVPQFLKWRSLGMKAVERIYRSILPAGSGAEGELRPILNPYNEEGSTRFIDFTTSKQTVFKTRAGKCHLNFIVYDSDWEAGLCEQIERVPEVLAYVKNHNLHFEVPYEEGGDTRKYRPDYIVHLDDGRGTADPLKLIVEIKGLRDDLDRAKADTMDKVWVPAVNNAKRFGRWAFLEMNDVPYEAEGLLRSVLQRRMAA